MIPLTLLIVIFLFVKWKHETLQITNEAWLALRIESAERDLKLYTLIDEKILGKKPETKERRYCFVKKQLIPIVLKFLILEKVYNYRY